MRVISDNQVGLICAGGVLDGQKRVGFASNSGVGLVELDNRPGGRAVDVADLILSSLLPDQGRSEASEQKQVVSVSSLNCAAGLPRSQVKVVLLSRHHELGLLKRVLLAARKGHNCVLVRPGGNRDVSDVGRMILEDDVVVSGAFRVKSEIYLNKRNRFHNLG